MAIRVECYAGYRGEQEPLAFWLGERRLAVREIVDRWFSPTQRWFKVDVGDGDLYVLRQDETTGDWDLAAYAHSRAAEVAPGGFPHLAPLVGDVRQEDLSREKRNRRQR